MTRSESVWACENCRARRVTRRGIESHVVHKHPDAYRRAVEDGIAAYRSEP